MRDAARTRPAEDGGMQRLFSMFPARRPGIALLVLRLALAVMLAAAAPPLEQVAGPLAWTLVIAVAATIAVGFATPIACGIAMVLEVWVWVASSGGIETIHVCAELVAFSLALLGPGAYSLDARFFGRRRVVLGDEDDDVDGDER